VFVSDVLEDRPQSKIVLVWALIGGRSDRGKVEAWRRCSGGPASATSREACGFLALRSCTSNMQGM
jgi:hypothetical protein